MVSQSFLILVTKLPYQLIGFFRFWDYPAVCGKACYSQTPIAEYISIQALSFGQSQFRAAARATSGRYPEQVKGNLHNRLIRVHKGLYPSIFKTSIAFSVPGYSMLPVQLRKRNMVSGIQVYALPPELTPLNHE